MKIALINPPFLFDMVANIAPSQCIGLRSIAAMLKRHGHEVILIDALMQGFEQRLPYGAGILTGLSGEQIAERIPADVALIGVSAPFSQLAPVIHDIIAEIRICFPEKTIIMGGAFPSSQPQLALETLVNAIVVGEGEIPMLALANGTQEHIQGVYTPADIDAQAFTPAERIADLDSLPMIDDEIADMDKYFDFSPRGFTNRRTAALQTSRGCPFDCLFCSVHAVAGHTYRFRSAANVLKEIRMLIEQHQINELEIEDDNFTLMKGRAKEILQGIIQINQEGTPLAWRTPNGIRIDTLDEEMIALISASNCKEIVIALEHGDAEMQRLMNKQLDLEKAFEIIALLIRYRIPVITLFYLVGYPGETEQHFLNGLAYLRRIKQLGGNIAISPNNVQIYPGTKLAAYCEQQGWIDKDYNDFTRNARVTGTGTTLTVSLPGLDAQSLLARRNAILEIFPHQWKVA